MNFFRLVFQVAPLVLGLSTAYAHHSSSAVFSNDTIEIEGVITEFSFKNPHVNIYLNVADDSGAETVWMATGPAPAPLRRWGWSADTVAAGQFLRLSGKMSRNGSPMILIEGSDFREGNVLEIDSVNGSIIRAVTGTPDEKPVEPISSVPQLSDGRPNLSGTWSGVVRPNIPPPPFNELGNALQAEFDAINDPAWAECRDGGLVRQAISYLPVRITQFDDRVLLEYEEFAARRNVYLGRRTPLADDKTGLGYSVARYEEDALVIATTQLLGNLANLDGNALSNQTTTIETYRRVDSTRTGPVIEMIITITDPGHLTDLWELSWQKSLIPDDYEFVEVDCRLPLQSR